MIEQDGVVVTLPGPPPVLSHEQRHAVSDALARWFDACWQDPHRRPVMEAILRGEMPQTQTDPDRPHAAPDAEPEPAAPDHDSRPEEE